VLQQITLDADLICAVDSKSFLLAAKENPISLAGNQGPLILSLKKMFLESLNVAFCGVASVTMWWHKLILHIVLSKKISMLRKPHCPDFGVWV
jgi:hypothetical protein